MKKPRGHGSAAFFLYAIPSLAKNPGRDKIDVYANVNIW